MHALNYVLHFDRYLHPVLHMFGPFIYIFLFIIIFSETAFVVTPFLPGDSLLFVVGTLSGGGFLNIWLSYILFLAAAILGNIMNYTIGHHLGNKVFNKENSRWFNKEYLERTHQFFEKYGGKTIILTRFMPVIRSFAPFVAGMGSMRRSTFNLYNLVGGFLWVTIITFAGYFFGGAALIKNNFETAIFAIIIISLIPAFVEYFKLKFSPKLNKAEMKHANLKDIEKTFKKEHISEE